MANTSELNIKWFVLAIVAILIFLLFVTTGCQAINSRKQHLNVISVKTSYPEASAKTIMNQVTKPLEQHIQEIPGIRSFSSVSSQGCSQITVEFEKSVNLKTATNDVQDKVSYAQHYLPDGCNLPIVSKVATDAIPVLQIGIFSSQYPLVDLTSFAEYIVREQLETIPQVDRVDIWGQMYYSMNLGLDSLKMVAFNVATLDIKNAVDAENIELPSALIEGNTIELSSRKEMETMQVIFNNTERFDNLAIKGKNNNIVRFKDIGQVQLYSGEIKSFLIHNGEPMVMYEIIPQSGANHIKIANEASLRLEQIKKELPTYVTIDMVKVEIDNLKK